MSITGEETPKQRLLARQVSLLRHLTDPLSFEAGEIGPDLGEMDRDRLCLVGRMSFDKRMSKIRTALPRTFSFFPHVDGASEAEFVSRHPPVTNLRSDNAQQFVDYLRTVWCERQMEPPYLPDLAAVEAAIAQVNNVVPDAVSGPPMASPGPLFRLARDIELLFCVYDVQTFFASGEGRQPPVRRDVHLVVGASRRQMPRICEVSPKVFKFLSASSDWRRSDIAEIKADPELPDLVHTLTQMQIIEVVQ